MRKVNRYGVGIDRLGSRLDYKHGFLPQKFNKRYRYGRWDGDIPEGQLPTVNLPTQTKEDWIGKFSDYV